MHSHQQHQHGSDSDWAARVATIAREGEVLMPYTTEAVSWLAALCRDEGRDVRRIADIGCGPGIAACVLAQQFDPAVVTAVDGSREMLEHAAARVEALGLSARVQTVHADLPAGLDRIGSADLIWMAMVLHHIDDQAAMLRRLRSLLEPGGILAIVEFGDPPRFLPDDVGIGRPGLQDRVGKGNLAGTDPSVDFPTLVEAAGFECIADRMIRVRLGPPLSEAARAVALGYLLRMRQLQGERLDAQDLETLDALADETAPLGIMHRPDAFLEVSRQVYVARAT